MNECDRDCGVLCVGASYGDGGVGCGLEGVVQCSDECGLDSYECEGVQLVGYGGRGEDGERECCWVGFLGFLGVIYEWRVYGVGAELGCIGSGAA